MKEKVMQPDLNEMMRNVQKMQEAMEKLQGELATTVVEGTAGGGAVKIACTGELEFQSVKIQADAIDVNDTGTLEDLVLTAIKDACVKAKNLGRDKMGRSMSDSGIQLPPGFGF
jgi:DNA-binding YbaB/EbfC family protein